MKFSEYAFSAEIKSGIEKANFIECTPVQEKTFNFILEGRDVYAQSQTGTGKTAAFLISIFHLLQTEKYLNRKALVVVPTRELAVQIKEEADILGQDLTFKTGCFYGGTGYKTQESVLDEGVDIVVSTPGRLLDFSKQGKINFKDFSILVVDEADRLFDMGFVDDIRRIFNATKSVEDKITLLFSATMNPSVGNISWEYMKNPGEIFIEAEQLTVEAIDQELYHVGKDEKMSVLLGLLKRENPDSAIIFTNTKHMAHEVSKRLEHNGYNNAYLMGDLPQKKRLSIVNNVKEGKIKFLVATDVAARGLHIDDLSLVINFDVPLDSENYVHRIGRTARAGKRGKAITLACENYVYSLSGIEEYIDLKIPVFPTTNDLFEEDTSAHLRFSLNEHKNRGRDSRVNNSSNYKDGKRKDYKTKDFKPKENKPKSKDFSKESDSERLARLRNSVMSVSGKNPLDTDFNSDTSTVKKGPKSKNIQGKNIQNKNTQNKNPKKKYDKRNKPVSKNSMEGIPRVSSESKVEDRLAYYKKKYGEDFKPSPSMKETKKVPAKNQQAKVEKKGFISKITSIFKK
ncbi:MAG: DEAD/DEAH box helicase [Spirochaetales bacterium]|nr:DEAD/DEAH box helicase [Spirochaetales bacterium]